MHQRYSMHVMQRRALAWDLKRKFINATPKSDAKCDLCLTSLFSELSTSTETERFLVITLQAGFL